MDIELLYKQSDRPIPQKISDRPNLKGLINHDTRRLFSQPARENEPHSALGYLRSIGSQEVSQEPELCRRHS